MGGLELAFDQPWFLMLFVLIPLVWIWTFRSLSGLGPIRRYFALGFRTAVLALLILAVANVQLLRRSDRLTVVYLLDQSASIPALEREAMLDYVVQDVELHRQDAYRDRASVIVFGRDANVEVPPLDDDLPLFGRLESLATLRTDATHLEAALRLAQATFPEDSARRVVIVSDGNENLGDALGIAQQLVDDGVGIDVVPVWLDRKRDVAIERVVLPSDIRKGQPFEGRIVVNNLTQPGSQAAGTVAGKLRIVRRQGDADVTLDEPTVELPPGKSVFQFTDEIDDPDFYQYQAVFVPAELSDDLLNENNRGTSFTHVRGKGHVLIVEDWENRDPAGHGEFHYLAERLLAMDLDVTVQFTDRLFTSLAELQRFDAVILANVPRSSGSSAENMQNFSDAQVQMLVRNLQQMGCGLVMMGGPNSFGAGGWANSELETAMPVDFRIKNAKVQAVGALAMVMHASEIPEGNYWQKVIAREALRTLGPQDYCAVVHWDGFRGGEGWLWGGTKGFARVGDNRRGMIARLDRMTPGDMPAFDPSMRMALSAFLNVPASLKHMIIISDGDPSRPSGQVLSRMKRAGIKITTVAVGAHGAPGSTVLRRIATFTGGKYYAVRSASALPKIYQREARRVARPLVVERELQPQIEQTHEVLRGIDSVPPITGFVMSTVKDNPLVEVPLISPFPVDARNATLLASWNYGAGRAVALTTDAGHRWATDWTGWPQYDKFFGQLVRWSMRGVGVNENFTVATQQEDDVVQIVVDALDKDDEFLNFRNVHAAVVRPDMSSADVALRQTAPGRYVGQFRVGTPGSYLLTVGTGGQEAPIRTGFNIPYSAEFRDRETNQSLLKSLATLKPKGGQPGQILEGPLAAGQLKQLLSINTFRRDLAAAVSTNYVWPWLLLVAGCVFFADVFVRRVAVGFAWVAPLATRLRDIALRRPHVAIGTDAMDRLRSRKAEVGVEIDQRRAGVRFEPTPDQVVDVGVLESAAGPTYDEHAQAKTTPTLGPTDTEEDDFTARLLKAKQDALKDRDQIDE